MNYNLFMATVQSAKIMIKIFQKNGHKKMVSKKIGKYNSIFNVDLYKWRPRKMMLSNI